MEKVSITDVAKLAKVSKATVSNFLNNKTSKLSSVTQDRIRQVIKELGYYPNLGAQRLSRRAKSLSIGIILEQTRVSNTFNALFSSGIWRGMSNALDEFGYRALIIAGREGDIDGELAYAKSIASIVDGYLLFNLQASDRFVREFEATGIPYWCVGKISGAQSERYVATDHLGGMKEAVRHLLGFGHRKIALFAGRSGSIVTLQRKQGYLEAFREAGLDPDPALVRNVQSDEEDLSGEVLGLLEKEKPSAIIVSQSQSTSVFKAIEQKKLSVPRDISVVVSQYLSNNSYEKYQCTYLEAPVYDVGFAAVKRFVMSLDKAPGVSSEHQVFPMKLVIGETTGKVLSDGQP